MRIGPAANVARLNVAETISALWTFENVLGLLTDVISERTGGGGVTIDGVRLRNTAVDLLGLASPANRVLGSDVFGDLDERFRLHAGGIMQWGDGAGARDTQLQRDAANELGTPDDFNVGGALDLAEDIEVSSRNLTLDVADNNDVGSGVTTVQRITFEGAAVRITGFAGGRDGRVLIVVNLGANTMQLRHQDVLSVAANRMLLPGAVFLTLGTNEQAVLFYDSTTARWRLFGSGAP